MSGELNSWMQVAASGTGDFFGAGVNAYVARQMNHEQRQYNNQMYVQQRLDALADWNRNNAYNHPQQQMERLKEAGLNPNLIYGKGAGDMTSPPIRASDPGSYKPHVPQFDFSRIAQFQDTQVRQAQMDNMRIQGELMRKEIEVKSAEKLQIEGNTNWINVKTGRDQLKYQGEQTLFDTNIEYRKEQLRGLEIKNDFTLDENQRREAMNAQNLKVAVAKVGQLEADKLRIKADQLKKEAETETIVQRRKMLHLEAERMAMQSIYLNNLSENAQVQKMILEQEKNRGAKGQSMADQWGLRDREVQVKEAGAILGGIKGIFSAQGKGAPFYDFGTGIKSSGQSPAIRTYNRRRK